MLAALPITLERPIWLLVLLLAIPIVWMARRSAGSVSRGKRAAAVAFRIAVLLLLATALAQPAWVRQGRGLTLAIVVDLSRSIPASIKAKLEPYLASVGASKVDPNDRIAVVAVAGDTSIAAMPDANTRVRIGVQGLDLNATNLALGLRTAKSILPRDTASRILLVSDGNETVENVLEEAEIARANGIPIDVLPLEYDHRQEVIIEGFRAPARARIGQASDLRIFIRSQSRIPGVVQLTRNGETLDLDSESPGTGIRVTLEPGPNTITVPVEFESGGVQQFRATFEPDDPATDTIPENNVGAAVTFVGGEGRVLLIDSSSTESAPLAEALRSRGLTVDTIRADGFTGGLPYLNGFDAVGLVNVPRWALNLEADGALHAFVHDLGGGLLMVGGPESFGAGGWIDTDVAKALPVDLDPPQTRQMPRGALALIMHSCEMPQANFWGQQVAIAAIEALSRLDYVGIISFQAGAAWAFRMQLAGDKSAPIAAARQMFVGDMPDFDAPMRLALEGLAKVSAGQRHAIIISDGDPQFTSRPLLEEYIANKITITTVMVAGHGTQEDLDKMNFIAQLTGGRFYNITNPKNLPQIFTKEAQFVSRSLLVEGSFTPTRTTTLPGPGTRFGALPNLGGYVLTAPRKGLVQTPLINRTSEADDPLLAYGNYGLGKSVAWTSDATGRWASAMVGWNQYADFWEETVRWMMRPPTPRNVAMRTRTEGEKAIVELEALDEGGGFMNFLRTEARVVRPDNSTVPLSLQQVGPGLYRGEFSAAEEGAYLINAAFAGSLTGAGESRSISGNIQAAVAVPYSREHRAVRDNLALLKSIADLTGGRVLSMMDPNVIDFFDREGLEVPESARRIWDLLAILAAAIFIFDVALRRIAIEPEAIAAIVRRLSRPSEERSESTVAAWKKARAQATTSSRVGQAPGPPQPNDPKVAARRFDADDSTDGKGPGFDVAEDLSGTARRGPSTGAAPTPPTAPPQDDAEPGDHTSRLLRAKRRANTGDGAADPPADQPDDGRNPKRGPDRNSDRGGERRDG